jgi:hypothetical protein
MRGARAAIRRLYSRKLEWSGHPVSCEDEPSEAAMCHDSGL